MLVQLAAELCQLTSESKVNYSQKVIDNVVDIQISTSMCLCFSLHKFVKFKSCFMLLFYTVSQKRPAILFVHNFAKCWSMNNRASEK